MSDASVAIPVYLNTFPLETDKRRFFYADAAAGVVAGVVAGERLLRVVRERGEGEGWRGG